MNPSEPLVADKTRSGQVAGMASTADGGADSSPWVAKLSGVHVTLRRNQRVVRALRGADLEIRRGEILGLVGESGSGKSVLGLSLLGLLPKESSPEISGDIVVDGVNMVTATRSDLLALRRQRLGAVFQDPMTSLDPTMRIAGQMREVVPDRNEAVRLLTEVGVPEPVRRLRAFPHELSGGLRQRVTIAMAVAGEPRLVIADEPTTALDVTVQAQILELLGRLRDEIGCSVLLITHDLAVAAQIADRIAVLYGGRVMELASTPALLSRPLHPYTAALLRSRLDIDMDTTRPLPTLEGEPPDLSEPYTGCPFVPRCPFAQPVCADGVPDLRGADHLHACVRAHELDLAPESTLVDPWEPRQGSTSAEDVLVAENLEVRASGTGVRRRAAVAILRGADLNVRAGEAVALVGESGCGKTTLLRAAAGLLPAHGGHLRVADDHPQMIFQDAGSSLTPWLPVGELVEDRLRPLKLSRKQRRERVRAALTSVGLPADVAPLRPAHLSGGQRQRVAIARAIVVPPRLLLCDEPTSALDVSVAASVLNLIGRLRRQLQGMAVLFVTHDLAVARVVADRVAVMYLGRIVEFGPAQDVIARPAHPYTRALIASLPGLDAQPLKVGGEPPSLYSPPSGCPFHPRCPVALATCSERGPNLCRLGGGPDHYVDCVHAEES
jgi:peptide/nickel transport system ATP-binding protein